MNPMRLDTLLRFGQILFVAVLAATLVISWRDGRRDRARLATQLAAAQQSLAAAASRQHDRDAQLAQTLAAIEAQKSARLTPDQIVARLARQIPLPAPLTLHSAPSGESASSASSASSGSRDTRPAPAEGVAAPLANRDALRHAVAETAEEPREQAAVPRNPRSAAPASPVPGKVLPDAPLAHEAVLPAQDLKPLYSFALDCQACQARLAAAQADLADEKLKTASLARERDTALQAAKGGSLLRRVSRACCGWDPTSAFPLSLPASYSSSPLDFLSYRTGLAIEFRAAGAPPAPAALNSINGPHHQPHQPLQRHQANASAPTHHPHQHPQHGITHGNARQTRHLVCPLRTPPAFLPRQQRPQKT